MNDGILVAQDVGLTVRESSNILFLAPSPHPMDEHVCTDLLAMRPPEEVNLWCLDVTLSAEERVSRWNERVGRPPAEARLVTIGDPSSVPTVTFSNGEERRPEVVVLEEPGNHTKIGVEFTNALAKWEDSGRRIMICIHSITALVQYAEFDRLFRFLHKLKNGVDGANAVAHYHMDPAAHDDGTVAKVRQLFDTVIEVDEDNSWHVTTREFTAEGEGAIPTLDALEDGRSGAVTEVAPEDRLA